MGEACFDMLKTPENDVSSCSCYINMATLHVGVDELLGLLVDHQVWLTAARTNRIKSVLEVQQTAGCASCACRS